MTNFKELVFDSENRLDENGNFKFPDCVKKIRIDVGLSNEAYHSCEWLLNNEDIAVIGVEANPKCQQIFRESTYVNEDLFDYLID